MHTHKGYAFKVLAPKDISAVLTMIGVHPTIAPDSIDKPTSEISSAVFQHLSEFAYDMDVQMVKSQLPSWLQHAEIFDEALDVITIFKLARQLAKLNGIEDFNLRDLWEPSSKRLRLILSGMINFCRYKEAQVILLTSLKEDVQALDMNRLDLVERSNALEKELSSAQSQYNAEMQDMREAESKVQEARSIVDKLQKQCQLADRVLEDVRNRAAMHQARNVKFKHSIAETSEKVILLREQVADSPEGLEQEIRELQLALRQQKGRLEERSDEKRTRAQREQVLTRLTEHLELYCEVLDSLQQTSGRESSARDATRTAKEDLAGLRRKIDSHRAEGTELDQHIKQMTEEIDRMKQDHAERVKHVEARRHAALAQHQDLQAKRTEEQRQQHLLRTQRLELESEVAAEKRKHEAAMADFRSQRRACIDDAEAYAQGIDALLHQVSTDARRRSTSPDLELKAQSSFRYGYSPDRSLSQGSDKVDHDGHFPSASPATIVF